MVINDIGQHYWSNSSILATSENFSSSQSIEKFKCNHSCNSKGTRKYSYDEITIVVLPQPLADGISNSHATVVFPDNAKRHNFECSTRFNSRANLI